MGSWLLSPRSLVAMLGSARDMGVEQAFPLDDGVQTLQGGTWHPHHHPAGAEGLTPAEQFYALAA